MSIRGIYRILKVYIRLLIHEYHVNMKFWVFKDNGARNRMRNDPQNVYSFYCVSYLVVL